MFNFLKRRTKLEEATLSISDEDIPVIRDAILKAKAANAKSVTIQGHDLPMDVADVVLERIKAAPNLKEVMEKIGEGLTDFEMIGMPGNDCDQTKVAGIFKTAHTLGHSMTAKLGVTGQEVCTGMSMAVGQLICCATEDRDSALKAAEGMAKALISQVRRNYDMPVLDGVVVGQQGSAPSTRH